MAARPLLLVPSHPLLFELTCETANVATPTLTPIDLEYECDWILSMDLQDFIFLLDKV